MRSLLSILLVAVLSAGSSWSLQPARIGDLQSVDSSTTVSGLVYFIDSTSIFIKDFTFSHTAGQDVYFCAGGLDSTFTIPLDINTRSFTSYLSSDLELVLPTGKTIASLTWFGVCEDISGSNILASVTAHPDLTDNVPRHAAYLGEFPLGSGGTAAAGRLYLINRITISIICFSFTQQDNEDTVFWTGAGDPSIDGFHCSYGDNIKTALPTISNQDIVVRFPEEIENARVEVTYLALWSRSSNRALSHVTFSRAAFPSHPPPVDAVLWDDAIFERAHNVRGTVYAIDDKTFIVTDFNFDGNAPETFFRAIRGNNIFSSDHTRVPVDGSLQPLGAYVDSYLSLTLPDDYTVHNTDFLAVWCYAFNINFGQADHPSTPIIFSANNLVPVFPPLPPVVLHSVSSEVPVNCKQLSKDITMSWVLNSQQQEFDVVLCGCVLMDNYVAFGLSGSNAGIRMVGSDVTWTWLDNEGVHAEDLNITAYSQCNIAQDDNGDITTNGACPDEQNTVHSVSGFRDGCKTCIKYTKPLQTSDYLHWVIWAVGPVVSLQTITGDTIPVPFKHYHRANYSDPLLVNFTRTPLDECNLTCTDCEVQLQPWPQPRLTLDNFTIYAKIGQSGGQRGYAGITGISGWGISWYLNGLLIPRVTLYRKIKYTFVVEGGDDVTNPAQYHPFYITDSRRGGYLALSDEERKAETVYAGIEDGNPVGVGRYCEYRNQASDRSNEFDTFDGYKETLELMCEDGGQPGSFTWTPDDDTPDTVFYQCATHQFLGWMIDIADPPAELLPVQLGIVLGSPFIVGNSIEVCFAISKPVEQVTCQLRREGTPGRTNVDCGQIATTFFKFNLTLDPGTYLLILKAYNGPGDHVTVSRKFTITESMYECFPFLVEDGIEVDGDTAILKFASTGVYDVMLCQLDREPLEPCNNEYEMKNLSTGTHRVRIIPHGCVENSSRAVYRFTIHDNGSITIEECPNETTILPTPTPTASLTPSTTGVYSITSKDLFRKSSLIPLPTKAVGSSNNGSRHQQNCISVLVLCLIIITAALS